MMGLISSKSDGGLILASVSKPQVFAGLFDRHARAIWRYACRRVGPAAADEVVSETFFRAFSCRTAYDARQSDARPWLYGIATNVVREDARDQARRHRDVGAARESDLVDGEFDRVEARVDATAQVPATAAALARLEPVDRDTLLLYALADLHYEQIATAMDVPVGTVRSRLNRARRLMRAELGLPDTATGASSPVADERSGR
jgi:RNA polymerase sigma factor (sigma-70 family)